MKSADPRKADPRKADPRKAVPVGMLALALAAFGGALGLKVYEERSSLDASLLSQQAREALALASQVRADMIAARVRMESLLQSGVSLDAVRKGVPFETVSERNRSGAGWAQIADKDGVRIFAKDPDGRDISGLLSSKALLRDRLARRALALSSSENAIATPHFSQVQGQRAAVACAPVGDSGIAACVSRPAPLLDVTDTTELNRLVIYVLLLASPLLAVAGLLQANVRLQSVQSEEPHRPPTRTLGAPAESTSRPYEVSGLIGFWSWDSDRSTLTLSEEAAAMIGALRAGEMTLDEFASYVAEDDRRKLRAGLEYADPMSQINVIFQGSGNRGVAWFELVGGAVRGGFSGALLNVTDRIVAQHRSRRAEQLARTALEAYPGPFAVWDSRRRLTHWNAAFQKVFNLDKAVVQVGASYDQVMAEVAKFVRVERPLGDEGNVREMLLISDQWISFVDRRTSNEGLISVGIDITVLKRQENIVSRNEKRLRAIVSDLERSQAQAQELATKYAEQKFKAEKASKAKSVFLASMSHELRTPLNAINGFSEMIATQVYGPLGDARYKDYADDILASGLHLLDMINDILDMAKIEAGKMQISTRLIDATDAVDAAVRMIRRHAADKGVSLQFEPDEDLPDINGDHRAIKQMTLNLVANAIKFTDPGGAIHVSVSRADRWIRLCVRDTGVGIAEDDIPRLGRPFEQAKAPDGRNTQGTGLGLALTKSFAEMHGGRLEIQSKLGVGTTVDIFLPIPGPTGKLAAPAASSVQPGDA